jgi:hypothetical protein
MRWLVLLLVACGDPGSGKFVGNPKLSTRVASTAEVQARTGSVQLQDLVVLPCEGAAASLGASRFDLVDGVAVEPVQLPPGAHCGLELDVEALELSFEADGVFSTIRATDFVLTIDQPFVATSGEDYVLQLGDDAWLDALAAVAVPGAQEVSGDLEVAWFDGLGASGIEAGTDDDAGPLAGRLTLADHEASPDGTPTRQSGCGAGVVYDLAVPVPPATMASLELDGTLGWCQGSVRFSDDLTVHEARQTDHSDGSSFAVPYNGWGQDCDALHCHTLLTADGAPTGRACTVLALCDDDGLARATGFSW